ncbi:hypothetical protein CDAR_78601 [Caerostris darwini]|uniref:Uncharacterized protein n=1 Tax=Caerostris darwini TaxID=1538125 RepID=A0AAV4QXX2_9ARAC|nr:hypothetical protein CDAR_78601 [Caerostris darwini]
MITAQNCSGGRMGGLPQALLNSLVDKIKRWKAFSHIFLKIPRQLIAIYGHCSKLLCWKNGRVFHKSSLTPLLTACILVVHAVCLSGVTIHHTRGNTHCTSLTFIVIFYP